MTDGVALAHDYATQRGGAERVALLMARAFPGAPLYTTLYDPDGTFPEFADLDIRTSALNRVGVLRRHHRAALGLLAPAIDRQRVDADTLLASSTGWAHGYRGARRVVVYCHAPARWLYQEERYLGDEPSGWLDGLRRGASVAALRALGPALRRWDRDAAARADVYLANSTATQLAIREVYGREAEVLPPPPAMLPDGEQRPVDDLEPGYLLCVARLLPYKNVDKVIQAALLTGRTIAVVGEGPERHHLEALASQARPGAVRLLGRVDDPTLRWLYANASALVGASYEDYGLSPLEAGAFGVPSVVFRAGGYLDTIAEGVNGVFFSRPEAELIAEALEVAGEMKWETEAVRAHVSSFSSERFARRLQAVVAGQGVETPPAAPATGQGQEPTP